MRADSKGNHQKVILIAALMVRPDLLILDEPTSGLDPLMEQAFRHCIGEARDRGQTVFLSSHIMSEVEALGDRVGILRAGKLIEMELWPTCATSARRASRRPSTGRSRICRHIRRQLRRDRRSVGSLPSQGADIQPLLKLLADVGVTHLVSRGPRSKSCSSRLRR